MAIRPRLADWKSDYLKNWKKLDIFFLIRREQSLYQEFPPIRNISACSPSFFTTTMTKYEWRLSCRIQTANFSFFTKNFKILKKFKGVWSTATFRKNYRSNRLKYSGFAVKVRKKQHKTWKIFSFPSLYLEDVLQMEKTVNFRCSCSPGVGESK